METTPQQPAEATNSTSTSSDPKEPWHAPLNRVTTVSKILAAVVFITLPFVGFLLGYTKGGENRVVTVPAGVIETNSAVSIATTTVTESASTTSLDMAGVYSEPIDTKNYTQENFLTDNFATRTEQDKCREMSGGACILASYLVVDRRCFDYFGGENCEIAVTDLNPYGLVQGVLRPNTGPYTISKSYTLTEIRVMGEGKLFLAWGFGDAGAISYSYSVWDTIKGVHTLLSGWGGRQGELMSISLGDASEYTIIDNTTDKSLSEKSKDVFDENMFMPRFSNRQGTDPVSYCIGVNVTPKDRANPKAPWLLEYSHTCAKSKQDEIYRYYEFDPIGGVSKPFTFVKS